MHLKCTFVGLSKGVSNPHNEKNCVNCIIDSMLFMSSMWTLFGATSDDIRKKSPDWKQGQPKPKEEFISGVFSEIVPQTFGLFWAGFIFLAKIFGKQLKHNMNVAIKIYMYNTCRKHGRRNVQIDNGVGEGGMHCVWTMLCPPKPLCSPNVPPPMAVSTIGWREFFIFCLCTLETCELVCYTKLKLDSMG